jgi:hypothetical protein
VRSNHLKVVLRQYRGTKPVNRAVTVKIANIRVRRPANGTFNGTYYAGPQMIALTLTLVAVMLACVAWVTFVLDLIDRTRASLVAESADALACP